METTDLSSARFWEGDENHIAMDPLRPDDARGLADFAKEGLKARGWCFFQTSGSEGLPKWVGLSKEAFLVSARAVNAFFDVTPADRWLVALPLHHVGGFSIYARSFASGSPVHRMDDPWDAAAFAAHCREHRATLTSLVPTQVFDLANEQIVAPPDLRAVIVGGGALAPALRDRARKLGWRLCCSYGMTEAASQIGTESTEGGATALRETIFVLPHWDATTDAESVLTIRGPALAKGYATRDERDAWHWQAIDPMTGLRTRDRVRIWQQGARQRLQFIGRETAFIKICGELVNVDALQRRLDDVADQIGFLAGAVIVPLDDPRRGATIVIAVELGDSSNEGRAVLLRRYNEASLPFERASGVRVVGFIPRSPLGKPRVAELAVMLAKA